MALECDRRYFLGYFLLFVGLTYLGYPARCKMFHSKIIYPFPQKSHECALKLTDLWITSLLFNLKYKFIDGSFAFSPG